MNWIQIKHGKVRTVYSNAPGDKILLVAGDGVSAFDAKLGVEIPGKGQILTQMSRFWFKYAAEHGIPTAYETASAALVENADGFIRELDGRVMQQKALTMFPVECVVRGYITGSMWKSYKNGKREICGLKVPDGLVNSEKLPEPLFTPTTKAPEGEHDENITFEEMVRIIERAGMGGRKEAERIRDLSMQLYVLCSEYALSRGIIIADTKFEFGKDVDGVIRVGDELFTSDSSRFWLADKYEAGREQDSLDKQIIRNYLAGQKEVGDENPVIPYNILNMTAFQYQKAYEMLTAKK